MLSSTTNSLLVPASPNPVFPVPQPHHMTSNGPTLRPPSHSPQSSSGHSGPPSPMPSSLSLHNPPTASSSSLGCDKAAAQRKQIRDAWVDAEGEIPIFDKDDESWTPIRYEPLASKNSGGGNSWTDGHGALLDNYFMVLEKASPTTKTKSSHIIQPIPLECLRLVPLRDGRDGSEVRKQKRGFFKSIGSCFRSLPTEDVYPLTVYHVAAKITRRHTIYTKSATERNRWYNELTKAVEVCQAKQPGIELYHPQTLEDSFFCVPAPRIRFTRGKQFTGGALCVAEFSYQGGHYLAVGCTNGIYVSDRASDSPFQRVLESDKPTSIVAVPEFKKFIVHSESALFSYPLDLVLRVSQEDAAPKDLYDSEERLAKDHGDVLFFKAGRVADQTLVVYAAKKSKKVTSRVLKLTRPDGNPQILAEYQPLGDATPIPEDPHDAIFFPDRIAICASKAMYILDTINPSLEVVPQFANHKRGTFLRKLDGMNDKAKTLLGLEKKEKPKILELLDKANILGMVTSGSHNLLVYDCFGCFVDKDGKPAPLGYFMEWECKATVYAHRGSHLLLFSPRFIEVRSINTLKLIQIVEMGDVRPLRCGWMERGMLVAATASSAVDDGSRKEKLVEMVYRGT